METEFQYLKRAWTINCKHNTMNGIRNSGKQITTQDYIITT